MSDLHTNGTANRAPAGAQDDIVAQVLAWWHDDRSRTHSESCWQWHPECAVAILGAEVERLCTALEVAANHMSMTGAPQTTIDAIRNAVQGG
jgi:hypothetical protein